MDRFGRETFTRRAVILPTTNFFPDPMDGTQASVRNLLDQVCRYMDVDPSLVAIEVFANSNNDLWLVNDKRKYLPNGAAGLYKEQPDRTIIHIEPPEFMNLSGLVGTMSHELAHLRQMGERRVTGDEHDNELLTDLTAVFHGFGIVLGNSPRNWEGLYSNCPGTDLKRPEYMSLPMFAYALTHTVWFRDQPKPEWYAAFSFDLKPCFKQSLRYLMETQHSTFTPNKLA